MRLAVLAVAVRGLPSRTLMRLVRPALVEAEPGRVAAEQVGRVVRSVRRAARRVPGSTCLTRALTGWQLLARVGIASTLRLGVARPSDAGFAAHAWLDCAGETILGSEEKAAFVELGALRARV